MENQMTDGARSADVHSPYASHAAQDPGEIRALRIPVGTNLDDVERWMIFATLRKCGGNKTRAAALLGVSLKTLYNRLNAYRAAGVELQDGLEEGQALAVGTQQATALHEAMIEVP